ncbi:MAG: T9SS type A sorting domain-containing protein [Bacteroidetes bacterium]|nr:T9SS type A sorting domain-containing protein [Bacteroidota bacterium]
MQLRINSLCIFVCLCCFSRVLSAQPYQHYGGAGYQFGYRIKPTTDGGFVAAGATDATDSAQEDYYVIRFDRNGHKLWDSAYGRHGIYDFLWSVQPTHDNGSLLAGYSGQQFSGAEEALLYKIDSNGRTVKKIEVNYAKSDHAHWFAQTSDGYYYWAGHTDSKGDPNGDMICQRLDSNFNLIWEKTYNHGGPEHCHAGTIARDGGCMLIGHTSVNNHEKFYAVRNDTSGAVEWQKVYSSIDTLDDSPYEVTNTFDGGFAFYGGSSESNGASNAWLLVVDSLGNRVLDHHFSHGQTFAWSGIQSSDSGFVIVGQVADTTMNSQLYVAKVDRTGTLMWEHSYGPGNGEGGYGIFQRGKQYVLTGELVLGGSVSSDLWIAVLDSVGNITTLDTTTSDNSEVRTIPNGGGITLGNCMPNPAASSTMLDFSVDRPQQMTLDIIDVSGRVVQTMFDARVEAGQHYVRLDTRTLPSGTYRCCLRGSDVALSSALVVVH